MLQRWVSSVSRVAVKNFFGIFTFSDDGTTIPLEEFVHRICWLCLHVFRIRTPMFSSSKNEQTFKSISDNVVVSLPVGMMVGRVIKLYQVISV